LESGGEAFAARKPLEEIVTESAEEVLAEIKVSLASRASEEIFLQTRLNGVGGDLHHATQLALQYIVHWGMGDTFFSAAATMAPQDVYTDPELRKEVERLLRRAYNEVKALFQQHRAAVVAVAEALLVREELHADEILELIRQAEAPRLAEIAAAALADDAGEDAGDTTSPQPQVIEAASANGHLAAPPPTTAWVAEIGAVGQQAPQTQPRQPRPP